tara:strand:+ start:269 stop:490 length:222 start_codon:yes stop_codon:yes gene_type:complete
MGGYGSETRIGISRSPKVAVSTAEQNYRLPYWRNAQRRAWNKCSETGHCGGGVPIMRHFRLIKNGVVIKDLWD